MRISMNVPTESVGLVFGLLQSNGFDMELTASTACSTGITSSTTSTTSTTATIGKKRSSRKAGKKTSKATSKATSKSMTRLSKSAAQSNQQAAANRYWDIVNSRVEEVGCTVKQARQWYKKAQQHSS